ncbi:HNH endonuclease [Cyanobacterium sp. IPPAS B-1200]|uniref:HNH endonuclease n=1 Tax=Cyanobacterium sp. IPPAS B-1200 TaxID=1562720 RepID=UPI0008524E92|nr:HNH endonuclease signature motif containing protein [Cyanobacterium sp. IPPAS B-1200]OEJ78975.1 HNH endonuclease [Cyanobacterium sp. IPPAS B-1200]
MSTTYIPTPLRRLVEQRAKYQCEYCLLPANLSFFSHEIDHIIAEKHGGRTEANNLAHACWRCNRYKGTDLGSFDPKTGDFCFLFNPRTQKWAEHFQVNDFLILGLTPIARTTVKLLQWNNNERIAERKRLQQI